MAFTIKWEGDAPGELFEFRAFEQRRIVDEVEKQLPHDGVKPSRNRKPLPGIFASFHHVPPIWELRVGDFRVFYDVDEEADVVHIRAVRRKAPNQTTEDIV